MTETQTPRGGRFRRIGPWKWLVLLLTMIVVVVAVGLVTSDNSSKSSSSASGLCSDKLLKMERSGTSAEMLRQHQQMMEQMRAGLAPQMQQLMDADPMWQLMRTGDFTQMMQDQQQEIDRMLASSSTCGSP